MNLPKAQRIHTFKPMTLPLLILMLMVPFSVHADQEYLYTYTSANFTYFTGPSFPSTPIIGDHMTLQFICTPAALAAAAAEPGASDPQAYGGFLLTTQYTLSSGALVIPSGSAFQDLALRVMAVGSSGLPTEWYTDLYTSSASSSTLHGYYYIQTDQYPGSICDDVWYLSGTPQNPQFITLAASFGTGTWTRTPVTTPLPATFLLFGSGLAGLAATRKKRSI